MRHSRPLHWLALLAVGGLLSLPSLGAHSLWDMDEGVNAECGREMLEAGTWIVPTFNWELRTAKPVLTYWLQRPAYVWFGVSEWSARLPSALCGLLTVLVTYELGRRLYDPLTGLLAGLALVSCVQHAVLSHAATPDAPLVLALTLAFALVWLGQEGGGRGLLVWPGAAVGLALLAKGPVGLALPGLATLLYFGWNRELRRLLDHRLVWGMLLMLAVAAPWYLLVAAETRGEWPRAFFLKENLSRAAVAQENHSGPPVYYIVAVLVLFAPWSSVIGAAIWDAVRNSRRQSPPMIIGGLATETRADRFLLCWTVAVLLPFSLARTKLPNYVAPVYPALALLTARFLLRWVRGEVTLPRWVWAVAVGGVALTGVGYLVGLLLASGAVPLSGKGMRVFPGLEWWAWVGLLPLAAAAVMAFGSRAAGVAALTLSAVGLVGVLAAGPVLVIDRYKAAKTLVLGSGARDLDRDIRLATYSYTSDNQSLVFYAARRVAPLFTADQAAGFLAEPLPRVLFVPAAVWEKELVARPELAGCTVRVRKYDFYKNADILAVGNGR
jgi:4-amino-4-deoxy-L-arabinose transferase-like glycosyltransferase